MFSGRTLRGFIAAFQAVALMLGFIASASEPTLINLGTLPGDSISRGFGMSRDGSTVTGDSVPQSGSGSRAFRWTVAQGMESLGALAGNSHGYSVSGDGSIVTGYTNTPSGDRAFRWSADEGMVSLGVLPGGSFSYGNGVSADGTTMTGMSGSSLPRAFRWTQAGGMVSLGVLPGGSSSNGTGVSGDGSIITGTSNSSNGVRAFRWTALGMEDLGVLPGWASSSAFAISDDGQAIAGNLSNISPSRQTAFRWTSGEGMVSLGTLPGGLSSQASTMSGDGLTVGGWSNFSSGGESRAFIWREALGMVDLNLFLPTLGVDLTGWSLTDVRGLSYDGSMITGFGIFEGQTRAWAYMVVPEPGGLTVLGVCALSTRRKRREGAK